MIQILQDKNKILIMIIPDILVMEVILLNIQKIKIIYISISVLNKLNICLNVYIIIIKLDLRFIQ